MIQYILQLLSLSHDSNDNNIYQYNYNNTLWYIYQHTYNIIYTILYTYNHTSIHYIHKKKTSDTMPTIPDALNGKHDIINKT